MGCFSEQRDRSKFKIKWSGLDGITLRAYKGKRLVKLVEMEPFLKVGVAISSLSSFFIKVSFHEAVEQIEKSYHYDK